MDNRRTDYYGTYSTKASDNFTRITNGSGSTQILLYIPSNIEDWPLCNSQFVLPWHLSLQDDGKQITFCKYKVFN